MEYNTLSPSQNTALDLFKSGKNIFLTGSAGNGKSFLINKIKEHSVSEGKIIHLTATTGIAAFNINAITIHSFLGAGIIAESQTAEYLLSKVARNINCITKIKNTKVLVIDEVSMISKNLLGKIDFILKRICRNSSPFGGIQMVLSGDLLQLQPIPESSCSSLNGSNLIIDSEVFKTFNVIELTTNFRQNNDSDFLDLLQRLRKNCQTDADITLLKTRIMKEPTPKDLLFLTSTNKVATDINERRLSKLEGSPVSYSATYSNSKGKISIELKKQFEARGLDKLTLKIGCRVMLVKNLNVEGGLVNGALGTVKKLNINSCDILFDNKSVSFPIPKNQWELNGTTGTQLPLILAYSCTIHKCQGLTLSSAILDLGNCFTEHMVYVALSRIKTLDGVYLKSFDSKKIKVNSKVLDFYTKLNL